MSAKIIEELKQHNIELAIEWAQRHESILEEMASDLLFVLYQQKVNYQEKLYIISQVYQRSNFKW